MKRFCFILVIAMLSLQVNAADGVKKNNLKTTVLSYITGSAKITYERALFEGQSVEITAGKIGVGGDAKHNNPKGITGRLAYKWIFPFSYNESNPLNGFYVKPEFAYSNFDYSLKVGEYEVRDNISRGALMGCIGW